MAEPLFDAEHAEYMLGNPDLPIANHRAEIEESAINNDITIIRGATGSGKSTNVSQYIHELGMSGRLHIDQIILTQPRVVATVSIADRTHYEMLQSGLPNPMVGHYTQPISSAEPQHTQDIAVLTAGKAAAQLAHEKSYAGGEGWRFLVIDEVHEFGKDVELLLALTKDKTNPASVNYDPKLKVVVMSATLDAEKMKNYYGHSKTGLIEIDVPTYPVESSDSLESTAKAVVRLAQKGKTVLAFHAGKGEIETTAEKIKGIQAYQDLAERAAVVTLHAQQNSDQQKLAFEHHDEGLIVLATNVAETSLTLNNVVAVVDTGEERQSQTSYEFVPTGHATLNVINAAQSSVKQRAGRAGRTEPGVHVRVRQTGGMPVQLQTLPHYPLPSIQRDSLDDMALTAKAAGKDLSDYTFYHTPPIEAIQAANLKLYMLGAVDADGAITDRGVRIDQLPLDPEFACMIAYAEEHGFSDQVKQNILDIVAIMQRGGIFSRSPKEQKWTDLLKHDQQDQIAETQSDLLAQLEAYEMLVNHTPQKFWEDFDVNLYAVEIVTSRRDKLAQDVGLPAALPLTAVAPDDRSAVLECIYAGQLPQLWRRDGETWQLAYNPKKEFDLHVSSVVSRLGKVATGSLFSVGTHGLFYHSVQDVSIVEDLSMLNKVADHLVNEVIVPNSRRYDADNGVYTDVYERKLGVLTLGTVTREVDPNTDQQTATRLAKDYTELIYNQYVNSFNDDRPDPYNVQDLEGLIQNPESTVVGTNIYSGQPILVWYGADRRPMRTKQDAVNSLSAQKTRIDNQPLEHQRRLVKQELDTLRSDLIQLSKSHHKATAQAAKQLRKSKVNTPEYLQMVKDFIAQNS